MLGPKHASRHQTIRPVCTGNQLRARVLCWALGDQRSIPQPEPWPLGAWVLTGLPLPHSASQQPCRSTSLGTPPSEAGRDQPPPLPPPTTLHPGSSLSSEGSSSPLPCSSPGLGPPAPASRSPRPPLPHPPNQGHLPRRPRPQEPPLPSPSHLAAHRHHSLSGPFSRTQVRGHFLVYRHC